MMSAASPSAVGSAKFVTNVSKPYPMVSLSIRKGHVKDFYNKFMYPGNTLNLANGSSYSAQLSVALVHFATPAIYTIVHRVM